PRTEGFSSSDAVHVRPHASPDPLTRVPPYRLLLVVGDEVQATLLVLSRAAILDELVDDAAHLPAGSVEVRRHLAEPESVLVIRQVAVHVVGGWDLTVRVMSVLPPVLPSAYGRLCRGRRGERGKPDRLGVPQVGLDGRHDDTSFDCQDLDPHHRDSGPGIDHDTFVENHVEELSQATRTGRSLHWRSRSW